LNVPLTAEIGGKGVGGEKLGGSSNVAAKSCP